MKKVINGILAVCVLALLFICWRSIQDDQDFNAEVRNRESVVKARLLQIRSAEEAYKLQHEGTYCADWSVLIDFVKNGRLPIIMKQGVLSDAQMDKGLTEAKAAAIVNSGDEKAIIENGLQDSVATPYGCPSSTPSTRRTTLWQTPCAIFPSPRVTPLS